MNLKNLNIIVYKIRKSDQIYQSLQDKYDYVFLIKLQLIIPCNQSDQSDMSLINLQNKSDNDIYHNHSKIHIKLYFPCLDF